MDENISTNQPTANPPIIQPTLPEEKKSVSLFPPKKTIILIIALVLITALLVYLSVATYQQPTSQTQKTDSQAFMQTSFILSSPIEESVSTQSAVPVYSMDINMDTGTNNVNAVQFELKYDPQAITNVNILPTEKTADWAKLIERIDPKNGIIYYALGVNLGQKKEQADQELLQELLFPKFRALQAKQRLNSYLKQKQRPKDMTNRY